jgi:hypothetical protein
MALYKEARIQDAVGHVRFVMNRARISLCYVTPVSLVIRFPHFAKGIPVLNQASYHGDVLGSGSIAQCVREVSGQLHVPAALPPGKDPTVLIG